MLALTLTLFPEEREQDVNAFLPSEVLLLSPAVVLRKRRRMSLPLLGVREVVSTNSWLRTRPVQLLKQQIFAT
jgi:hypothetical protein